MGIFLKNILMNNIMDENRWTDAPIALLQSGGIRSSIDESDHDGIYTPYLFGIFSIIIIYNTKHIKCKKKENVILWRKSYSI